MEAAGVIALVRATASTALQARTLSVIWKDAPRDVFHLRDELDTCKTFLESIQSGIVESSLIKDLEEHHDPRDGGALQREPLRALLRRGEKIAKSIGEILTELLGEDPDGTGTRGETDRENTVRDKERTRFKFKKKFLWLRRLEAVTKLRKMLRRTTDDIALSLTMLNVQITTLHAIRGAPGTASAIEESESNIIARITDTVKSTRYDLQGAIEGSMISVQESLQLAIDRRLEESFHAMSTRFENTMLMETRNYQSRLSKTTSSTQVIGPGQYQTSTKVQPVTGSGPGGWTGGHTAALPPRFRAHLHAPTNPDAQWSCQCLCHNQAGTTPISDWKLPWLRHVLGSVKLSYHSRTQALESRRREHQVPSCQLCSCANAEPYSAIVVQYRFPPWLAKAILSMYYLRHHGRPELLIRVNRIISISDNSDQRSIFGRICANDIDGVKRILTSCPQAINDILEDGSSVFHCAVFNYHASVAKLLLQAGADPFPSNDKEKSAALLALFQSIIYSGNDGNNTSKDELVDLLPPSRVLEEDDFTDLHRVVVGELPLALEVALANPAFRTHINSRTVAGLAPLHLAAQTCRTTGQDIRRLVAAGADPNMKTTNTNQLPLNYACWAGNQAVVSALLATGASPRLTATVHPLNFSVLHFAAQSRGGCSRQLIDTILSPDHGVDINARDSKGITPLVHAVVFDHATVVSHLIERGAEMDTCDCDGDTPLNEAVSRCSHRSARILLGLDPTNARVQGLARRGLAQRYRYINWRRGWGICHWLAVCGDTEMMEIFSEVQMTGLEDLSTFTDIEGNTALDLFRARTGVYVVPGCHGPPRPEEEHENEDGDEGVERRSTRELVQAWRKLLGSINQKGEGDEDVELPPGANVDIMEGCEQGGGICDGVEDGDAEQDWEVCGESDSGVEFFDAEDHEDSTMTST